MACLPQGGVIMQLTHADVSALGSRIPYGLVLMSGCCQRRCRGRAYTDGNGWSRGCPVNGEGVLTRAIVAILPSLRRGPPGRFQRHYVTRSVRALPRRPAK